ncbi:MAG: class I SAM-dependent methyltransferase [Chloroflexota bacterium]
MPDETPPVTPVYSDVPDDAARKALHEGNRESWNEATRAHNSHKRDQAKFFRDGGHKLREEEIALLGDVHGLSVLHLQCNSGQDTLSIKQLGAARVTGVDISDEAIDFAQKLSAESGLEATFVRADVYDWLAEAAKRDERWDIVYCSFGAVIWLSDLDTWARGIEAVLKPSGRFVVIEFHPVAWMFDENFEHKYPYSTRGRMITWSDGIGDYVGQSGPGLAPSGWEDGVQNFQNPHPSHEFAWGLSEIVQPLLNAGLMLTDIREYYHLGGLHPFKNMVRDDKNRWVLPPGVPGVPLMYSVVAQKPAS